eukprot:TRINITY_DN1553_c0_g1_i1.p1 TRINITY_DN1553_c0_g1~~TRINITY_DN1553_c0_g1_i1.p1  ORF type:complete len:326 (+),score=79.42 TRINITY_DN1553_c0_g1_i1:104-979(+)
MHFFEKQRVDAAGILGVKLQKALIFLGVVSLTAFFFGAILPSVFSLLILAIGFSGAYRRRPCLLSLYFWINIIIAILGVVFVVAMMVASTQTDMAQSNGYSNEEIAVNPIPLPTDPNSPIPTTPYDSSDSQSSQSSDSFSSSIEYDSSTSYYVSGDYSLNAVLVIVLILCVVLSVLITFFKVFSIVLAWKMRSLLLASPTLPVCSKSSASCTSSNPTYPGYAALPQSPNVELETSVAVPETPVQNIQGQAQMMYMPFPYNNNNGAMMLNQYGQPVFYTYQPMNGFVPQTPQ